MALPAVNLPAAPNMLGADNEAKQEYFAALQSTLDALDARANKGPNWFQLAGALLDPGRTGNVGEAFGRASTVLGAQQERQADMQLPIAQARAQLAGQKYETENQSKAITLLSQTLGVPPEKAIQQLSAGSIPQSDMSKLAQVYPVIAQLSPKVAEIVKNVFSMQKDIGGMNIERDRLTAEQQQRLISNLAADRTAGMNQADLVAKYGAGVLSLIPGGGMSMTPPAAAAATPMPMSMPGPAAMPMPGPAAMPMPGPAAMPMPGPAAGALPSPVAGAMPSPAAGAMPSPAAGALPPPAAGAMPPPAAGAMPRPAIGATPSAEPATTDSAVLPVLSQIQDLRQMLATTRDPALQASAKDALQKLEADLKTRFGISLPPMPPQQAQVAPSMPAAAAVPPPQAVSSARPSMSADLQGLPLATQADVAKKRIEESDKPFNTKRDEILNFTPTSLQSSNTNLRQLDQIARQKPQIFALMQKQGLMSGLLTLAEQGAQLTAGTFNARLGLPVQQFLEKVKLSEPDQQSVRDVSRILAAEFLSNVKATKGLLGVNPTDNDARLLQAPMVNIQDSAKAVQLWSRQQILLNKQRESMYGALSGYLDSAGPTANTRQFFSPGSVYDKINKDYAQFRMQLFRQFYPKE